MAHQEIGRGRGADAGVAGVPIAVPFRELRYCTAGIGEVPGGWARRRPLRTAGVLRGWQRQPGECRKRPLATATLPPSSPPLRRADTLAEKRYSPRHTGNFAITYTFL